MLRLRFIRLRLDLMFSIIIIRFDSINDVNIRIIVVQSDDVIIKYLKLHFKSFILKF